MQFFGFARVQRLLFRVAELPAHLQGEGAGTEAHWKFRNKACGPTRRRAAASNLMSMTSSEILPGWKRILLLAGCAGLAMLLSASISAAQEQAGPAGATTDPNALARDVLANEVQAQKDDQSLWSYRQTEGSGAKTKVYFVCQVRNGEIRRLAAVNGEPLSPSQERAERARVRKLTSNPEQVRENAKKQHDDAVQGRNLLAMFPKAFLFENDGEENGLVRLRFTPNPAFHPTSRASEAFHHMEGTMLLDARAKRLAEIHGVLTSEVKFWGGLLGHLDPGGTFEIVQRDVGGGFWEMISLHVNMNGKALLFKTITVRQHEDYTDFERMPENITLQQAAERVESEPAQTPEAASNSTHP